MTDDATAFPTLTEADMAVMDELARVARPRRASTCTARAT